MIARIGDRAGPITFFVGAGASIEAQLPSWLSLVRRLLPCVALPPSVDRDVEFEIEDVRAGEGDEVAALVRNQSQRGRQSGIPTGTGPFGLVFTIRGAKVVRCRLYPDHQSALEAAGLEE